ncbi:hypothetical protein [Streptosporangium saharense]|uniref:hypothetical protein n=1 Tax=Streptosporangium saharense TaxID=1706840 RepID=UPI00331B5F22
MDNQAYTTLGIYVFLDNVGQYRYNGFLSSGLEFAKLWRLEDQAGAGQATVDQVRLALDLLQLAFDHAHQTVQVRCGEIGRHAALQLVNVVALYPSYPSPAP